MRTITVLFLFNGEMCEGGEPLQYCRYKIVTSAPVFCIIYNNLDISC